MLRGIHSARRSPEPAAGNPVFAGRRALGPRRRAGTSGHSTSGRLKRALQPLPGHSAAAPTAAANIRCQTTLLWGGGRLVLESQS